MLFNLDSSVVFLTGVSGQLGIAYLELFLQCGAKVFGFDKHPSMSMSRFERESNGAFHFFEGDVTNRRSLETALATCCEMFGTPTVLINNAALDSPPSNGQADTGPFEDYPEESWDKVLAVNLKGVYLCSQVVGSAMAMERRGSIINISSIYGLVSPDQSIYEYLRSRGEEFYKPIAYSASKSGVLNLTRYLATYWARKGVRVNSLTIAGVQNGQDSDFLKAYCERIPIGRMASPMDYFGAIIYLSTDASTYMTGSNMIVDGGWTAI